MLVNEKKKIDKNQEHKYSLDEIINYDRKSNLKLTKKKNDSNFLLYITARTKTELYIPNISNNVDTHIIT